MRTCDLTEQCLHCLLWTAELQTPAHCPWHFGVGDGGGGEAGCGCYVVCFGVALVFVVIV